MELSGVPEAQRPIFEHFIEAYKIEPTVDDYTKDGLVFTDLLGKTIAIASGERREKAIYFPQVDTDIVVITIGSKFLGWVSVIQTTDLVDRRMTDMDALSPLPTDFKFAESCAHLSQWGGWMTEPNGNWNCFGCGRSVLSTISTK